MPTPLTISFCRLALLPTEATLADGAESVLLQLQWIVRLPPRVLHFPVWSLLPLGQLALSSYLHLDFAAPLPWHEPHQI